jgi:hypothetical protein
MRVVDATRAQMMERDWAAVFGRPVGTLLAGCDGSIRRDAFGAILIVTSPAAYDGVISSRKEGVECFRKQSDYLARMQPISGSL